MVTTEKLYVETASSLEDKLSRCNQIIEALELQMLNAGAVNSDIAEYSLNDGQVQIRTSYRSIDAIAAGIERFYRLRELIINKLNGRGFVLRPWEGMR
jgi:hypothetical protein